MFGSIRSLTVFFLHLFSILFLQCVPVCVRWMFSTMQRRLRVQPEKIHAFFFLPVWMHTNTHTHKKCISTFCCLFATFPFVGQEFVHDRKCIHVNISMHYYIYMYNINSCIECNYSVCILVEQQDRRLLLLLLLYCSSLDSSPFGCIRALYCFIYYYYYYSIIIYYNIMCAKVIAWRLSRFESFSHCESFIVAMRVLWSVWELCWRRC